MREKTENSWFICFEKRPQAQTRLICFAHAGGSASVFATWHKELPSSIELSAVRMPGRDERRTERARTDFTEALAEMVDGLRNQDTRPVALFGYSLGALFAFECARALATAGTPATHLFVAARRAPQLGVETMTRGLSDEAFARVMGQRYGGIPQPILDDPDLLRYFLPIIRADIALLESYAYREAPPLPCGITALGGERDPRVSRDCLQQWSLHTTAGFELRQFPGGHFFVTPDQRGAVLRAVAARCTM